MSIQDVIAGRGITEVFHFTTNKGLLGILDARSLKSRARLKDNQRLEFILNLNTPIVKDPEWEDFANLSISRINSTLYQISSERWHADSNVWWCVLAFDPIIMTHEHVTFTTTNNIYPSTKRGQGNEAFERLFAPTVLGRYSTRNIRHDGMPDSYTTCEQAEVLYPGEISTEYLKCIYVSTVEDQDDVRGQLLAVNHPPVEVVVNPRIFGNS